MQTPPIRTLLAVLWLSLLLAGCAPTPVREAPPPDPELERARALLASDPLAAADLFERVAARSRGEARATHLLTAAEARLAAGDTDGAERTLRRLDGLAESTPEQRLLAGLLRAELALARRQADRALEILLGLIAPEMPADLQRRHLRDLADAYRQVGNLLESANTLQQLDALLDDPARRLEVQREILRSLTALNERTLTTLRPVPPGVAGGWMDLALLLKRHDGDPERLARAIAGWRAVHPRHPALPELVDGLAATRGGAIERADHVAVLLPQGGRFAGAAAAIRDGLMTALYALPEAARPRLRFYDTRDPADAWPLYAEAVAAGAQAVIGPLQKAAVEQFARAGELPVPVLALNKVATDLPTPAGLYMFSLDPEHEARLAAERIWQDGMRHPVVLVPEGAYGERLAAAFTERWEALTGEPVDVGRYDPRSADHSRAISALLHLDRSKARHARLQRWLGRRIEYEPRRRADVDVVFLVASPRQARSLKPQLAFFRADDLPVYATSRAWTGRIDARALADVRGIHLPDIPLIVDREARERLAALFPAADGPAIRLLALGIDALRLQPHLRRLRENPWDSLDGRTGNLHVDAEGRVERQLLWIVLDEPPRVLGYSRRMDLPAPADTNPPPAPPPAAVETRAAPR